MAKDSSGGGSGWATGIVSQPTTWRQWGGPPCPPSFSVFFEGTVASTDLSRATDVREKERLGIFSTDLAYAGSYGRVLSESIGRDLNPLGRGAGQALVGGTVQLDIINAPLPYSSASQGIGNSVNNDAPDSAYSKDQCEEAFDKAKARVKHQLDKKNDPCNTNPSTALPARMSQSMRNAWNRKYVAWHRHGCTSAEIADPNHFCYVCQNRDIAAKTFKHTVSGFWGYTSFVADTYVCCRLRPVTRLDRCDIADTAAHEAIHAGDKEDYYNDDTHDMPDLPKFKAWMKCWCK
jgi:hypothetical protein